MAKPILSTNYKDDILNVSTEGKRKYRMNYNDDGTVSFVDVTPYDQEGSDYGAGDINLTNEAVNQSADAGKIIDDPDTAEATTENGYIAGVQLFNHVNNRLVNENGEEFRYGYQDGKRGVWVKEADTDVFVPFKSGGLLAFGIHTHTNGKGIKGAEIFHTFTDDIAQIDNKFYAKNSGTYKVRVLPFGDNGFTNSFVLSNGNTQTMTTNGSWYTFEISMNVDDYFYINRDSDQSGKFEYYLLVENG